MDTQQPFGGPDPARAAAADHGDTPDDVADVRLLIGEPRRDRSELFDPEQIRRFLRLSGGSVKRAAARALLSIAASEVLLSKKITTQDLSTDGPSVAAELRAQARDLIADADADDARTGPDAAYAAYIPAGPPTRQEGTERWAP
ncbi:hypothetical protein NBM05_08410 [Rothia sp. AR01]|uniref:Uncharacterized protein n=1 Tax=Rothia santali TaxID=2949643 RepID=A0A9X2KIB0_9MICC|nr:hypothetical protein [Rothia santali]MCP3426023.1 hypothetical protein [Rothia santali]